MGDTDFDWTKEDFLEGIAPYEEVYQIEDPFRRQQTLASMASYARGIGVQGFLQIYKNFEKAIRNPRRTEDISNATEFEGQPMELDSGRWTADDTGVYQEGAYGERLYACNHPVMPVERLVNLDTGEEKLRLAYRKGGGPWRTLIADKRTLASASKVTELAGSGIAVTSDNARHFIRYLFEVETLNYDRIPERRSVGRLGYLPGAGFCPYVPELVFDGDAAFQQLFRAVTARGTMEGWREAAQWARRMSVTAKVMLAASFASPLLEPLGALPFFVHLWGVDSGTGKTVALMLAASVWGDPSVGRYVKTFDSTVVGCEKTAAFLNHLPLCLDELQLSKDGRGRQNFDVYRLAEGVGRTRGNRSGGVDHTPTWRNTILTTGESPLTGEGAGAGAVNRVIDIECASGDPAVPEGCGGWLSGLVREHYGHAGKAFVTRLYGEEGALAQVKSRYDAHFQRLSKRDTTEKQAMAAAAILTADELACQWVFQGEEKPMTEEEIGRFLASRRAVSAGQRGHEYIMEWLAANKSRFVLTSDTAELWGDLERDRVYILSSKLREALEGAGYSYRAVLSWLDSAGKLMSRGGDNKSRKDISKRINGIVTRCVCLKLEE